MYLHIQKDLASLAQWAKTQSMVFNVDKNQIVLFDHRGQVDCIISYALYGPPLNFVQSLRYLGVTASGDFRRDNHVNNVASKAYKSLGMVFHEASRNVKKMAYMTLCRPVMEFACEV